jgi:hypothetical protein
MSARHRLDIGVPSPYRPPARARLAALPAPAWAALGRAWRDPEYLVVLGILVLGGVLRLSRLDLIEFRADQAATVADALSIRQGHLLPMALGGDAGAGATSLMAYLTAALMALRADPRFVAAGAGLAELGVMVWLYLHLAPLRLRVAIIALLLGQLPGRCWPRGASPPRRCCHCSPAPVRGLSAPCSSATPAVAPGRAVPRRLVASQGGRAAPGHDCGRPGAVGRRRLDGRALGGRGRRRGPAARR